MKPFNALNIENPKDPGVDKFLGEDDMQHLSKNSRIEYKKKQMFKCLHASQRRASLTPALEELEKALKANNKRIFDVAKMRNSMKLMESTIGDGIYGTWQRNREQVILA